ncbi:MAG: hypothetical protein AAGD14_01965 [Planctomycetota bacterium]
MSRLLIVLLLCSAGCGRLAPDLLVTIVNLEGLPTVVTAECSGETQVVELVARFDTDIPQGATAEVKSVRVDLGSSSEALVFGTGPDTFFEDGEENTLTAKLLEEGGTRYEARFYARVAPTFDTRAQVVLTIEAELTFSPFREIQTRAVPRQMSLFIDSECSRLLALPPRLTFPCETDDWQTAPLRIGLRGEWGPNRRLSLVEPAEFVRLRVGPRIYLPGDELAFDTDDVELEVEVDTRETVEPGTLRLRVESDDDDPQEIDVELTVACDECNPENAGPVLVENRIDGTGARRMVIGVGTQSVIWTLLDDWLLRAGRMRVESPRVSPDGRFLAFIAAPALSSSTSQVYLLDLQNSPLEDPVALTPVAGFNYADLAWSRAPRRLPGEADTVPARHLLAAARRTFPNPFARRIVLMDMPATGEALDAFVPSMDVVLSAGSVDRVQPTWSPDDERIIYNDLDQGHLFSIATDGSESQPELVFGPVIANRLEAPTRPQYHPTRNEIAFGYQNQIWFMSLEERVPTLLLPNEQLYAPVWSPSGESVIFQIRIEDPIFALSCGDEESVDLIRLSEGQAISVQAATTEAIRDVLVAAFNREIANASR